MTGNDYKIADKYESIANTVSLLTSGTNDSLVYGDTCLTRVNRTEQAPFLPNICIIMLESFGYTFTNSAENKDAVTPFLDSLSNHGSLLTNLYTNGNPLKQGLVRHFPFFSCHSGRSVLKRYNTKAPLYVDSQGAYAFRVFFILSLWRRYGF